ncbi:hypothetical protein RQN30_06700 [Arcanobacterium hippocoleae]
MVVVVNVRFQILTEIPSENLRNQIVRIWQGNVEAGAALGARQGDPLSRYEEMLAAHELAMSSGNGLLIVMADAGADSNNDAGADGFGTVLGFAWWILGIPEGKPRHIATVKRLQVDRNRRGEKLGRLLLDYVHSPEVLSLLPAEVEFLHLQFRSGEGLGQLYAQYGYEVNVRWDFIRKNDGGEYDGWIEMIRTRSGAALPEIQL